MTLPLVLALPSVGSAQRGALPTLVFTIFGGYSTGHDLWSIPRQTECVGSCLNPRDTVALSRSVGGGLAAGLTASYHPTDHLGFHFELALTSLTLENGCTGIFYNPDSEEKNRQRCDYFAATAPSMSAVSILAGITLRAAPRGGLSPYARTSVGLLTYSRSTVEANGVYFDSNGAGFVKPFIFDDDPRRTSLAGVLAIGFTLALGPGYQFRLEVSDLVASMERVTGPANASGQAPTASGSYHHVGLSMGLGVVLERQRGRRY